MCDGEMTTERVGAIYVLGEKSMSTTSPAVPAAEAFAAPRPDAGQRLASLDAFRGFTMFWLMGGKPFLMAIAGLGLGVFSDVLKYELTHTPWVGLRYYDLIWPSFMLMVGVSIPFG